MGFVTTIILVMVSADVWWWYFADRAARRARLGRGYRMAVGLFMGMTIVGLVLLIVARMARLHTMIMPESAVVLVYVWHFLLLPLVLVPSLLLQGGRGLMAAGRWLGKRQVDPSPVPAELPLQRPEAGYSRRAFLAGIVVAGPPVATLALTGRSLGQLDDISIRRTHLGIPNLPPALEGMTIAHVSDPHIGSFMSDEKYKRLIELTNNLDADLVLQTGDLINHSLNDLPDAINMLRQFRGRHGVFSCQGNHDCIDSRRTFERDTTRADVGLLLDESRTIEVRGQKVTLLGPRWWGRREDVLRWSVERLAGRVSTDAFGILLAHHPHCFDTAAELGIPLSLAGHTHGGQIALSKTIGFGPQMYRYWHGPYRQGKSVLNVSAGTGNWFPLRIGMPCEIIQLTLFRV